MVQVDVFWTYGLGAGFAMAAARQLTRARDEENRGAFDNPFFTKTLLYLSVLFVPSGVCLLWAFPSWETMHVGDRDLPTWLVTAFAATNMTQGILGFFVAYVLIMKRRLYAAYLQWILGYVVLWFILIHGWDGTGYMRFFSESKEALRNWEPSTAASWASSDVALTLYGMGVVILPLMFWWMARWLKEGHAMDDEVESERDQRVSAAGLARSMLFIVFGLSLGTALSASLLIHWLGWIFGLLVFFPIWWLVALRRGGLYHRWYRRMLYADSLLSSPSKPQRVVEAA